MDVQLSSLLLANQYAFHALFVGIVIVSALLVYVFGFKPPVEPPFDKLTNPHDERKANGKKRKTKDKKSQSNGHVTGITETRKEPKQVPKKEVEKSPVKEKKSEKKPALKENRDTKPLAPLAVDAKKKGKGKENIEVKNKKNKAVDEKPKDFDDGEWEQAPSRKDKKNKKSLVDEILQSKTDKKKEQKKKKDEGNEQKDLNEPIVNVKPLIEEIVPEPVQVKTEVTAESDDIEPVEEPKPKRNRRKKASGGDSGNSTSEEKTSPPTAEPVKPSPATTKSKKESVAVGEVATGSSADSVNITVDEKPLTSTEPAKSPPKPKKEPTPAPEPTIAPKVEPVAEVIPHPENTVAFDELGDTWKEARAPKKGGKKKSRKE